MLTHFISLEWKSLFRSASFGKSIAIKIMLGFFALYFIAIFLTLGVFLFEILAEIFPDKDPFMVANGFLFYWVLVDLLMRFFFQKLPVMSVKPLLTLPVKKSKIINYVLGKSAVSFFNFLPLFAFVPFSIKLLLNDYDQKLVVTWLLTMLIITMIVNFLNFIIETLSAETELSFLPLIVVASGLFALDYFNIVSFSEFLSNAIHYISENPATILILLFLLVGLYRYNFKLLYHKLYLDNSLQSKRQEVKTTDLSWTKRFGDIAPFMQLDLKLLWRNKRPRSSVFILVMGLFYGLFFYPQEIYANTPFIYIIVGIFVTGVFLLVFGQFIPAWDSGYYKLLMSQNLKYEQYLRSKFVLMIISVIIMFVLNIPYVYFGWKILIAHFAAAIYNIGVNSHVMLFAGSFNRKKIDLNQRAAFNYQGTGAVQWLIALPVMFLPMLIFMAFYFMIDFNAGITAIIMLGLLGIAFHQKIMALITSKYIDSKYKMIDAFSQDN